MVKAQEYVLLYQCGMMKVKSEKKVLIVDDNPDILVSVKEGLEAMDKKKLRLFQSTVAKSALVC